MDKVVIKGGRKLKGEVSVSGAKNAALPIMAAAILSEDESIIENVPDLRDIHTMVKLLRSLGARVHWEKGILSIRATNGLKSLAP